MSQEMRDLVAAIKEHASLDDDEIRDAGLHGADTGWGGFTYTTDGAEFYRNNFELVDNLLQERAEGFGLPNVLTLMAEFGRADMGDTRDGLDCLKAWFALEMAGQWLLTEEEEEVIATTRLWRWLGKVIEVTEPGQRCDWVTTSSPYYQLGMARQLHTST